MTDVANIDAIPLEQEAAGSRFAVGLGGIGQALGLKGLGAVLHVVPAGKAAWPFHRHHAADEMFLIVEGTGEYRLGDERLPIKAGDCLGAPAGGKAHQIINTSSGTLRYIAFSNNSHAEITEYPDSGKLSVRSGAARFNGEGVTFRMRLVPTEADYWDGEDIGEESK